jgi:DNA-binding NarL/FixJ family response regulator
VGAPLWRPFAPLLPSLPLETVAAGNQTPISQDLKDLFASIDAASQPCYPERHVVRTPPRDSLCSASFQGHGMRRRLSSGQRLSWKESLPEARSLARKGHPGRTGRRRRLELAVAIKPALLRDVLSRLLDAVPQLRVVGYGENEEQIRKALRRLRPPVLLFDYEAMGPNAESVISRLRRAAPVTRILVIAGRSTDENVEQVLHAGASGLVGKHQEFGTLVKAIHAVAAGELWANRRTAAQALERLSDNLAPVPALESLTKRELEIVDGVALGLRNKEIAQQLSISQATVKSHLNSIFRTLKIEGRVALAMLGREREKRKD